MKRPWTERLGDFVLGRGFYIVLVLCVAAIGVSGYYLMHSVGSIPHGAEIDVPLNYADYYFLEDLKRKRDLEK